VLFRQSFYLFDLTAYKQRCDASDRYYADSELDERSILALDGIRI
jgi:hypothetical protein